MTGNVAQNGRLNLRLKQTAKILIERAATSRQVWSSPEDGCPVLPCSSDAALSNFERAKRCFERAGLEDEWSKTVRQVRADHNRKSGFMPGFERLVDGMGPSDEPSFLDRAKVRWRTKERSTR